MLTTQGFGLGNRRTGGGIGLITPINFVRDSNRGLGDTSCPDGMMLDTRTDPPHCIGSQYAYKIPQTSIQAYDYTNAPGCHVVDLSRNACQYADGNEGGCNSMPECDPLTGALHYQYGLPGGATNVGVPSIKTGVMTPSIYNYSPQVGLVNPTGGTPFVPSNSGSIQDNINKILGPTLSKLFTTAINPSTPKSDVSAGSNNSSPTSLTNLANGGQNAITTNPNKTPDGFISTVTGLIPTGITNLISGGSGGISPMLLIGGGLFLAYMIFKKH